jgi:hypothetical protein
MGSGGTAHTRGEIGGTHPRPTKAHDPEKHSHTGGGGVHPVNVIERHHTTGRVEREVDIPYPELL